MFIQGTGYHTALDKWPLDNLGRNGKQLVSLGNYLDKLGVSRSNIDDIKESALNIPILERLNMKKLASVYVYMVDNNLSSMRSISEFNIMNRLPDYSIEESLNNTIATLDKSSKNKMSIGDKEIYKARNYATWLRYLDICMIYLTRSIYDQVNSNL